MIMNIEKNENLLPDSAPILNQYDAHDKDSIDFSANNPNAIRDIFNAFSERDSDASSLSNPSYG
jgi:hypothetical protein